MNWTPVAPDDLPLQVAGWLADTPGVVRVAIDGSPAARPDDFAAALLAPLQAAGRAAVHVRGEFFWRDASLRFEMGREDVESYLTWLDAEALRREVLDPAVVSGHYLPSLRDPVTNRSTREPVRPLGPEAVVLVSGSLLLGQALPFDRTVHLALSPAARRRRTADDQAWTLPAHASYDATVRPTETADLVVKLDDPRHPAMRRHR